MVVDFFGSRIRETSLCRCVWFVWNYMFAVQNVNVSTFLAWMPTQIMQHKICCNVKDWRYDCYLTVKGRMPNKIYHIYERFYYHTILCWTYMQVCNYGCSIYFPLATWCVLCNGYLGMWICVVSGTKTGTRKTTCGEIHKVSMFLYHDMEQCTHFAEGRTTWIPYRYLVLYICF